jgi:hypothetical protein
LPAANEEQVFYGLESYKANKIFSSHQKPNQSYVQVNRLALLSEQLVSLETAIIIIVDSLENFIHGVHYEGAMANNGLAKGPAQPR